MNCLRGLYGISLDQVLHIVIDSSSPSACHIRRYFAAYSSSRLVLGRFGFNFKVRLFHTRLHFSHARK